MSKDKILEDFFDKGYSDKTEQLIPSKDFHIKFKNIGMEQQMEIEEKLKDLYEEPSRVAMQKYAIYLLARTLIHWNKASFKTPEEWEKFLNNQSVVLLDKALKLQQNFETEVKEALEIENVKKNSSPTAGLTSDSNPLQEESSQEKEEASEKA